jgi:hypothetical protein
MWDAYGKDLCPICKKDYKPFRYPSCWSCRADSLPDGQEKAEMKARAKEIENIREIQEKEKIEYKKWKADKNNARECDKDENGEILCMEYLYGDCGGNKKFCKVKFYNRRTQD